jgi:putative endopeptidase
VHPTRLALRALGALALVALIATTLPLHSARAAGTAGLDVANLDRTCNACDDFDQFATGGWTKSHTIPPGHATWGSFDELAQHNREALHSILEDDAKDTAAAPGSDAQKLGTFYRACMDEDAIEHAGTAPIDPMLTAIAAVHDTTSLVGEIGRLQIEGVGDGLDFSSEADTKNSAATIASIGIGGLGLPDRDYYLKDDARTAKIRTAYHEYVAAQLHNLGEDQAAANADADAIVGLETAIASATPSRADLRDPKATYHPMPVADLPGIAPHIPWKAFFAAQDGPAFTDLDVNVPTYVTGYDAQIAKTPLATWKAYLRFHLVDTFANTLPKRFVDTGFGFHSTVLYGVKEQLPRWQRCTSAADRSLGTPLGKAYVAADFPASAKARAQAMVDNLQSVLREDIGTLDWMSAPTKAKAVEKLDAFTKKIGYPDHWEDYSTLQIPSGAPYAAVVADVRGWNHARDMARIDKPTERWQWGMTPPTVNAYYDPSNNEIVFPAGILQPPFFDAAADDAVNYGAIGAVIGHEMTHGFDDQGRQYDKVGNLADWWSTTDAANFDKRAQCIVDEFNGLSPIAGVHENGRLVQGEAIADLGGTTIAFRAFTHTAEYKANKTIDGFTPAQRFFLAYAQVWRSLQTDDSIRQLAVVDPHPNDRLRVIGTLSNMPEFAAAFKCAATSAMVRKDRCQIW